MKKINLTLLIALAVVAAIAFTGLFVADTVGGASVYTDFASARTLKGKVHVIGEWTKKDQVNYNSDADITDFWMQDSLSNVTQVRLHDPLPPNFGDAEKVVVIGEYQNDIFEADKILMKCPSKYEPEIGTGGGTAMKGEGFK
ncbi:MAG: cytochrome c maturation protein CcmE [Bacteroidia bacterium]|nr:cytochrome c maturation protein CcmE [Bacteroidia bacterium]